MANKPKDGSETDRFVEGAVIDGNTSEVIGYPLAVERFPVGNPGQNKEEGDG